MQASPHQDGSDPGSSSADALDVTRGALPAGERSGKDGPAPRRTFAAMLGTLPIVTLVCVLISAAIGPVVRHVIDRADQAWTRDSDGASWRDAAITGLVWAGTADKGVFVTRRDGTVQRLVPGQTAAEPIREDDLKANSQSALADLRVGAAVRLGQRMRGSDPLSDVTVAGRLRIPVGLALVTAAGDVVLRGDGGWEMPAEMAVAQIAQAAPGTQNGVVPSQASDLLLLAAQSPGGPWLQPSVVPTGCSARASPITALAALTAVPWIVGGCANGSLFAGVIPSAAGATGPIATVLASSPGDPTPGTAAIVTIGVADRTNWLKPDGAAFVSADADGVIRLWWSDQVDDTFRSRVIDGADAISVPPAALLLSSDGRRLVIRMADGRLFTAVPPTAAVLGGRADLPIRAEPVALTAFATTAALSKDGKKAFVGETDGRVHALAFADESINLPVEVAVFPGAGDVITQLSLSPDGTSLAVSSLDGRIRLIDVARISALGAIPGALWPTGPARTSPDPRFVQTTREFTAADVPITVFVQIRQGDDPNRVSALRSALQGSRFQIPAPESMAQPISQSSIRFCNAENQTDAVALARSLQEAGLGSIPVQNITKLPGCVPERTRNVLELWLAPASASVPSSAPAPAAAPSSASAPVSPPTKSVTGSKN